MVASLPGQRAGNLRTNREILASTKHVLEARGVLDSSNGYDGANTNYEWELRPGTPLARITSSKKWVPLKRSQANADGTAATALVVNDARAFKAGETLTIGGNQAFRIGAVIHDASAASNGTAVYVSINADGVAPYGQLQSANAGSADSYFDVGTGGGKVRVEYIASPGTNAFQVYFNASATNQDERFIANISTLQKDVFVRCSDGRLIRIKYDASASSNGVALYFDDDGATVASRLLYVSGATTNGRYITDRTVTNVVGTSYISRTTGATISSVSYSTNTITLSAAVTWASGDAVYCDSLAGSETCRGFLNEYVTLKDDDNQSRDKQTGKIVVAGLLASGQVLGDLTAIRADSTSVTNMSQILWDDQAGQT